MKYLAAVLSATFLAAGLATPGTAMAADTPYIVNVITSLTGGAAFLGTKETASLQALVKVVNADDGIKGHPLALNILDDASNPQTAVQLTNQLITAKAPFIFGPTLTATCQAVAPLIDKTGPVEFCLSPTIFPRPNGYQFMGVPSIDDVQPAVFRYLKSRGLTKIGLITSTDSSGQDFEKRVAGTMALPENKNMKIVAQEHFGAADISVSAQMSRIKAAGPDVLMTFTVGTPFGTLLHGIHDAGLEMPVYGSGGNFTYAQMASYAEFLPKELILNGSRGITPDPIRTGSVKKAQDVYFAAMKSAGIKSEFASTIPWDPMMIMVDAVKHLGTDATSEQIYTYLQWLKGWTGIEGTYDFTAHDQRGLGVAAVALYRWDAEHNEFVSVYPPIKK
jgi:branched-chain amino acid transport system substrate-binding protein